MAQFTLTATPSVAVMASAAETETAGVFGNAQDAIAIRIGLKALAHKQPPTPLKTDNTTCESFVHLNIRQRRSKTWDMCWNWLHQPKLKEQLRIYWDKGPNNDADYFTKHHPPAHHLVQRPQYVLSAHNAFQNPTTNHIPQTRCEGVFLPRPLRSVNICSDSDRLRRLKEPSILRLLNNTHNLVS